jgi:heme/copper-type cytochrome/quinol oxidase subunit 1
MTTIDAHAAAGPLSTGRLAAVVSDWFTTTDHKRIGRHYIFWSLLFGLGAAVLGVLVNLQQSSDSNVLEGAADQVSSLYVVGLTFLVVVPLMLGVATAVVPLQVGARSIAFPRLAATGFWLWACGADLVVISHLMNGGLGGGRRQGVELFLTGHLVLVFGLLCGAVSLTTTVLTTRAAGMNMRRVPPFTWSALVFGVGLILTLPVLQGTTLYNYLNYRYGGDGFGGNKEVSRWLGFAFTQPMTFVYAVLAFGFLAEMAATATRRRLAMRGFVWSGVALVGVAAFGAITQSSSTLRDGVFDGSFGTFLSDAFPHALFNLLPLLGAVIAIGLSALTLKNKPALSAPLVFAAAGALMVLVGLLANAVVGIGDFGIGGRAAEGVWVYVMYGAVLTALGALLYWGPKLWGQVVPTKKALPLSLLGLGGTILASLPLVIGGIADDRDFDKAAAVIALVGHAMMALTVLAVVGLIASAGRTGELAANDPWDGQTLEWATASPAPHDNFDHVRTVTSAEPLLDMKPNTNGSAE